MATVLQNQEGVPENMRELLAVAVRSIQWSYAIFWSISASQPGVLEWGDGYYNGDIKTRKTVQAVILNADQMGLQRSEQLRELYESLAAGEANPQARRPSAALSPEDLTETEWYYLVCMSFVFNVGEGLPGRTLANGQTIWLCNAHFAESKVFSRSLLAKSASIQTVVCFPLLDGVVELGATELVLEDHNLIQHIKATFLEIPNPIVSNKPNPISGNTGSKRDPVFTELDCKILETSLDPIADCEVVGIGSRDNSLNGIETKLQSEESFMVEGINEGASQVQSWHFVDDEFRNGFHTSMNSSDCISQAFVDSEKIISIPNCERVNNLSLLDLQDCNHSLDLQNDDVHYHNALSALLKSPHQFILAPYFRNCNKESSFVSWKRGGLVDNQKPRGGKSQRLLKKVLFEVARMHGGCLLESHKYDGNKDELCRPEVDEIGMNHVLSERKRREKMNERFSVLQSLVPSISKVDKVSILDDTIKYLRELKSRVDDLKYWRDLTELESRTRTKPQDSVERTSDDCGKNKIGNGRSPFVNKRKACDIVEMEPEINLVLLKDSAADDVTVNMMEKEVLIEMRCPWREGLLLEIMDALSNLNFDSYSAQSSIVDGILSLTIKSKFKGSAAVSAGMLREALRSLVRKF